MRVESTRPILLQPVDSPRRDLEAKIVQAAFNAMAGFTTIIGGKGYIGACHRASRNAFWVGRLRGNDGRTAGDLALCDTFDEKGTRLFFHHDEGAFHPRKTYRNSMERIHPLSFWPRAFLGKFMVWGDLQRRICLDLCPESESKIAVTGTPRFDLYNDTYRSIDAEAVANINEKYGRFVLFCTQFKEFNFGPTEIKPFSDRHIELYRYGFSNKKEVVKAALESWRFCGDKFAGFLNLILDTALSFPDVNVVVRVHPSEDITVYGHLAAQFDNIAVVQDGDIRPFLRAAEVVVHSESTTGVEALLAGRFTVNWTAVGNLDDYAIMGASAAGVSAHEIAAALSLIEKGLRGSADDQSPAAIAGTDLSDFIANLKHASIPSIRDLLEAEAQDVHASSVHLPKASAPRRLLSRMRHRISPMKASGRHVSFRELSPERLHERVAAIPGHASRLIMAGNDHVVIAPA